MGVVIVEGEGAVLGVNLRRPIVTNGAFATRLFSNYFEDLFFSDKSFCGWQMYERLRNAHPNMKAYKKEDIPDRYHIKEHYRVPPLYLVTDEGYGIAWVSTEYRIYIRVYVCRAGFKGGQEGRAPGIRPKEDLPPNHSDLFANNRYL